MVETFHLWRGIRITDEIIYNLETDVSDTWGPKFFDLKKKISSKSLLYVKDKSTYGTVENFPYGHLCNTDTSPISTADNFLCPDRILLYSLYNKEPSWYRPSLMRTTYPERHLVMASSYSEKRSTRVPAHVSIDTAILRVTPYWT